MKNEKDEEILRPIMSLISKSEKAQKKLAPETWQYSMLQNYIEALHIAHTLISEEPDVTTLFLPNELQKAADAVSSMINKAEKVQLKFKPGTSQHTLQLNRIKSLRMASEFITKALRK